MAYLRDVFGAERLHAVLDELITASTPFQVEPMPDGWYTVSVKPEVAEVLAGAVERQQPVRRRWDVTINALAMVSQHQTVEATTPLQAAQLAYLRTGDHEWRHDDIDETRDFEVKLAGTDANPEVYSFGEVVNAT